MAERSPLRIPRKEQRAQEEGHAESLRRKLFSVFLRMIAMK